MSESLQARLTELRQRLRQMTWLYGLSWLVAVVLGATLFAGLLDWSIRLEDAGVRLILGLSILAAGGWISWRLLVRPLRRQISDVEIALRIEKRYPGFNDSLASTVQFLEADHDPKLGSPAMQKQVVERTVRQVKQVNLSDIVETRRAIATELRRFFTSPSADKEKMLALCRHYGELDGDLSYLYATHFAGVGKTLTARYLSAAMTERTVL